MASTTDEGRQRAIKQVNERVIKARDAGIELPGDNFISAAMLGMMKRDGFLYASPKSLGKDPAASVTHRLYRWHGSGGNLHGYMFVRWDMPIVNRTYPDVTFDQVDSLALVLRGGQSRATDVWSQVLHGR